MGDSGSKLRVVVLSSRYISPGRELPIVDVYGLLKAGSLSETTDNRDEGQVFSYER